MAGNRDSQYIDPVREREDERYRAMRKGMMENPYAKKDKDGKKKKKKDGEEAVNVNDVTAVNEAKPVNEDQKTIDPKENGIATNDVLKDPLQHETNHVNGEKGGDDKDKKKKDLPVPFPVAGDKGKDTQPKNIVTPVNDQKNVTAPSNGDEPGTSKGVMSNTLMNKPALLTPSHDVKIEGKDAKPLDKQPADKKQGADEQKKEEGTEPKSKNTEVKKEEQPVNVSSNANENKEPVKSETGNTSLPANQNGISSELSPVRGENKETGTGDKLNQNPETKGNDVTTNKKPGVDVADPLNPKVKDEAGAEKANAEKEATPEAVAEQKNAKVELEKFRKEISLAKTKLKQQENSQIKQLGDSAAQQKKNIDKDTDLEVKATALRYNNAIKDVRIKLSTTKRDIHKNRHDTARDIRKLADDKIKSLDKQIWQKQKDLVATGNKNAINLEDYRDLLLDTAKDKTDKNKATLLRHADQLTSKYKNNERAGDIDEATHKMARGTNIDVMDTTYNELKEGLDEDTEELAGDIREEAKDNSEGLSDGKEDVADGIRQVRDEIIKQEMAFGVKELSELDKTAAQTIKDLEAAREGSIKEVKAQGKRNKESIDKTKADIEKNVRDNTKARSKVFDSMVSDIAKDELLQPDPLTVEQIENARVLKEQSLADHKSQVSSAVSAAKKTFKSIYQGYKTGLASIALQSQNTVDTISGSFADTCTSFFTNFSDGFAQYYSQGVTQMDKMIADFMLTLDDKIHEADLEWSGRVEEAKPDMQEKYDEAIAVQTQAVPERMVEMKEEAERISTSGWFGDLLHAVWELAAGLLGFLWDVIKAIGILILVILVIVAIIALIAGIISLFVAATFGAIMANILAFLIVWGPLIFKALLIIGTVMGLMGAWKTFAKAFTDPNLTFGERMRLIGKGLGEVVTTIGLGWMKFGKMFKAESFLGKLWLGVKGFIADIKIAKQFTKWWKNSLPAARKSIDEFASPDAATRWMEQFKGGPQFNKMLKWTGGKLDVLERLINAVGGDAAALEQLSKTKTAEQLSADLLGTTDDAISSIGKNTDDAIQSFNKNKDDVLKEEPVGSTGKTPLSPGSKGLKQNEADLIANLKAQKLDGSLPINTRIPVDKAISTEAMRAMSKELGGVEIAQIFYKTGPKEGQMVIVVGGPRSVAIPYPQPGETPYFITHVHPGGTTIPSKADIDALDKLRNYQEGMGMPQQKSSTIIPEGSPNSKFNSKSDYVNSEGEVVSGTGTKSTTTNKNANESLILNEVPSALKPEAKYLGSKKHGIYWTEGIATAKKTKTPQGQWGSTTDLDFAGQQAATLPSGQGAYFELPAGSTSKVYTPEGLELDATHIWVRNNGTGTFHGYPLIK